MMIRGSPNTLHAGSSGWIAMLMSYLSHTGMILSKKYFKFSKSLGQNFLIDDSVPRDIVSGAEVCKDDLIVKTRKITEELVDSAQRFIKLYREYRNDVLSEEELINSVEFLNKKITHLFFLQSDLPYPPKELHDWSNAHTLIAGTIHDFSLY